MDASHISFGVAFIAGVVSFLSPCVLPLVPIYIAQLVGQSASQSTARQDGLPAHLTTFFHALMFVLGFTLAFVALGATASTLGSFFAGLPGTATPTWRYSPCTLRVASGGYSQMVDLLLAEAH